MVCAAGEPIFCKPHTNPAPRDAASGPRRRRLARAAARWSVGIREASSAGSEAEGPRGALGTSGWVGRLGYSVASPTGWDLRFVWERAHFLQIPYKTGFAGLGSWPTNPPARAQHCALAGGYVRKEASCGGDARVSLGTPPRQPSRAAQSRFLPCRLRVVPYGLPGYRRLRRAPPQQRGRTPPLRGGGGAASGKTPEAQGTTPCAPRGGLCGCLAARQTSPKPPGVPTGWGSLSGQHLPDGPPLGAPRRRLRGAFSSPLSPADGALGNSGGESRCDPRRDRRTPDEQRGHAGPQRPPTQ